MVVALILSEARIEEFQPKKDKRVPFLITINL